MRNLIYIILDRTYDLIGLGLPLTLRNFTMGKKEKAGKKKGKGAEKTLEKTEKKIKLKLKKNTGEVYVAFFL